MPILPEVLLGTGLLLDRGYTDHSLSRTCFGKHLQDVELIHMNGRLYDPLLHRFLAPDNYVQDPYNTQNFNRYGYVYNNPLMYTDPSGEVAWFVPVFIGAAVSAASYTVAALTSDIPFTAKGIITATLIGGVSGAATFGISEAVSTIGNLATRITVQSLAQGSFQGFASGVQGGNFWQGFASGALSSLASSLWVGGSSFDAKGNITSTWNGIGGRFAQSGVGQISFGTVSGGGGAALSGGNFWEGAATGFAVSSINYLSTRVKILDSPVGDAPISSEFMSTRTCEQCSNTHGGTDYAVPTGTPVVATADGTVARAYTSSSYGNVVIINHGVAASGDGNVYTLYAHGSSIQVQQGASVKTGDLVIYSGNTGNSTGPHLHYEVIRTNASPSTAQFFGNLQIRYAPTDLKYLLKGR